MKSEYITFWQEVADIDRREHERDWQRLAELDPDYEAWHDERNANDSEAFEAWLDTKEGRAWLYAEEFEATSREDCLLYTSRCV